MWLARIKSRDFMVHFLFFKFFILKMNFIRFEQNAKEKDILRDLEIKLFRCLEPQLQLPPENPVFCHRHNPINFTFVMECCKDEDFCNVHLSPKLMPRSQGNQQKKTTKFNMSSKILLLLKQCAHFLFNFCKYSSIYTFSSTLALQVCLIFLKNDSYYFSFTRFFFLKLQYILFYY